MIELKVLSKSLEQTMADGLAQTWQYIDTSGAETGHLVIFDRDPQRAWQEKIFRQVMSYHDTPIVVWGM